MQAVADKEKPLEPVRSIHIKTFGCQMNVYDSDRMSGLLKNKGYRYEADLRQADVVIINTCSIRDKSEQKVLSLLGQLQGWKKQDPRKILGVSGCVGQRIGRRLLQRVPHLDLVFGPDSVDRVVDLVESVRKEGKRVLEAKFDTDGRHYQQPMVIHQPKVSEFITIMKGCDHFCTYCIVPFVRGREKSRSIQEIIGDVERLVAKGTKEVTFLGQNINTYGKGREENLAQLIEATNGLDGLRRIRYVTSHPRDLGEDLISQFGKIEKLCPALHLPFQSGSDKILKAMLRLYTRDEYLRKVSRLRECCPDIALSADVIVGFPGETDADFELTMSLLAEVKFSHLFLFKYSPRPGTRAFAYEEEVPEKVKNERLQRALALANAQEDAENRSFIGQTVKVLVESLDKKQLFYTGRTLHNKIAHVLNAGDACVGKVLDVEITEANGSNLRGYYAGAPKTPRSEISRNGVQSERTFSASL